MAAWINDQPLDINNADQRIDNDPKIGHQYHVSISKYTNDKMGIEIIISVYSVCLVINNMDYYIDVIEKDKNLTVELKDLDHKISLIKKNDADYIDMLYRQKFNYVTEDEIIIKIK